MEPNPARIKQDFAPFFRVHSSGRVERLLEHDFVLPGEDLVTGVVSRDVVLSPENLPSVRIFLPKIERDNDKKLPLIIYIHGGAFSIQSAFSSLYHDYVNRLASAARSVVVSIEYRLAPEHPIPACYDDSFAALKWVGLHAQTGKGPDPWLNEYADFNRVYAAGDSAGGNIAHHMVIRSKSGSDHIFGFKFSGLILMHPFFGMGKQDKLWDYICSDGAGPNDVRLNPLADTDFPANLGCNRVLVCIAEKDLLRGRGEGYFHSLKERQWSGAAGMLETPGNHVFFLFDAVSESAVSVMNRIVGFINYRPLL